LSELPSGAIVSEHRYSIPLERDEVWRRISDVGAYRQWWPWLRRFEAHGLTVGEVWHCQVKPPMPYSVRFSVHIEEVVTSQFVRARVSGDVMGTAELHLEDADVGEEGSVATLSSVLAPASRTLQLVATVASPAARFGHDFILDSGARRFIARSMIPIPKP
jgi:uncharacterized protein YndB with AHSA1/START domain